MKRLTALIFILFFSAKLFSQLLINRINTYEPPKEIEGVNTVVIKMPYGKADVLLITGDTNRLRNAGDILIDIVCTDFPTTSSLNKLNSQRLDQFFNLFPYVNPTGIQKIKVLRQIDGSQKNFAQDMFHGIVIKFRLAQTKETMLNDVTKLDKILSIEEEPNERKIADSLQNRNPTKEEKRVSYNPDSLSLSRLKKPSRPISLSSNITAGAHPDWLNKNGHDSSCYLIITPENALRLGYITKKDYTGSKKIIGWKAQKLITITICEDHLYKDISKVKDKSYPLEGDSASTTDYSLNKEKQKLPDSTLFKILKRNKWTDMDIVGDVTGSMYPYTGQLLLWLKLQSLDSLTTYYSFFNDGDDLPDRKKIIGKTGGIYSNNCSSFSEVLGLVKKTMLKGGGGDSPENNIEAILQAEKKFSDVAFHVLIADNWAPIKDISIAKQISKPVRIVLCGVLNNYINTDYLDLARITKGSVHLMEHDLFNLATLHEGEVLRIGKKEYKIINGHFKDNNEEVRLRL